jgi:hopanoid biosynthesis associated protein HpnK
MITGLIVTADDFGVDEAVNEAVERGHDEGILTAASLMVTGAMAADAAARARRLPALGVGLHVVLVDGRPALPPDKIPDLVDAGGRFRTNMVRAGVDIFFRPAVRRQLAAEIEAQFAAFAATGLTLDHVNSHKHFHLHPTIGGLILRIGARYGLRAIRAPVEPGAVIRSIEGGRRLFTERVAAAYAGHARRRAVAGGLVVPDQVFGLAWSGAMTAARLAALIERLPAGLSEIYLHPAAYDEFPGHVSGYAYRDELQALLDPNVARAARDVHRGRFADFGR